MLSNLSTFVKTKGSSLSLSAHGQGGANTTPFQAAHFVLQNTPKNGGEKEAGKGGAERANNRFQIFRKS